VTSVKSKNKCCKIAQEGWGCDCGKYDKQEYKIQSLEKQLKQSKEIIALYKESNDYGCKIMPPQTHEDNCHFCATQKKVNKLEGEWRK